MEQHAQAITQIYHRIAMEIARDRKKAALLGSLTLAMCVLFARLVLSGGPETAGAAAVVAKPLPTQAEKSMESLRTLLDIDASTPVCTSRPALTDSQIARDIFAPNTVFFPVSSPAQMPKLTPTANPGEEEAEAERMATQAQAASLILESTIVSELSTAIINGRVLREGDWISGFKIVEIRASECDVEKNNVKVTLGLKKTDKSTGADGGV